jgi:hypothetical protein
LKSECALKSIGLGRSREPDRNSQLQHHTSNGGFGSIRQALQNDPKPSYMYSFQILYRPLIDRVSN